MKITLLTIFPEFFPDAFGDGMIRVAREKGRLDLSIVNLRDFTTDPHRTTDDYPFGGGAGMVMKVEPVFDALTSLGLAERAARPASCKVVLTSPQGPRFTQETALEWSELDHLVILCGRYKGVDERVAEHLVDAEFSLGDFVLSGGEPAALCVVDALARLQPDVVGCCVSVESDSFHSGLLDCAYYTRPAEFRGWTVPEVLLSGHHAQIARARREEALRRTFERRPDLLDHAQLSESDQRFLRELARARAPRA